MMQIFICKVIDNFEIREKIINLSPLWSLLYEIWDGLGYKIYTYQQDTQSTVLKKLFRDDTEASVIDKQSRNWIYLYFYSLSQFHLK